MRHLFVSLAALAALAMPAHAQDADQTDTLQEQGHGADETVGHTITPAPR